jgi:hypothetical protein
VRGALPSHLPSMGNDRTGRLASVTKHLIDELGSEGE